MRKGSWKTCPPRKDAAQGFTQAAQGPDAQKYMCFLHMPLQKSSFWASVAPLLKNILYKMTIMSVWSLHLWRMSSTKSSFCVSKASFVKDVLTKVIIRSLHTESPVLSMSRPGPIYASAQGFLSLAQGSRKARARLDKSAQEGDICDRFVHYRSPKLHFWRMSLTKSSF